MDEANYNPVTKQNDCSKFKSLANTGLCSSLRETFLLALQSCVDNLAIYQHTLMDANNISKIHQPTNYKGLQTEDLNLRETKKKLQRDSAYVRKLLQDITNEVQNNGTLSVLINLIEKSAMKKWEENNTIQNYLEAKKTVEALKKSLNEVTIVNEIEMKALRSELTSLREEKLKLELKGNFETKYASAWEKAQSEQYSLRSKITLQCLNKSLQDCLIRKKNEIRVAEEIEAFLKQNIAFNERSSSHWKDRYKREMQMYIEKNNRLLNDIETRRDTIEKLEAKFSSRQDFIDGYLGEKEAAKILKEHEEYKRKCAIQIQAWWRGIMVRRKLGPYRLDEKKKKKPGKK